MKRNGEICLFSILPPFLQRNRRKLTKIAFYFQVRGVQKHQMGLEIADLEVAKRSLEEASSVLPTV